MSSMPSHAKCKARKPAQVLTPAAHYTVALLCAVYLIMVVELTPTNAAKIIDPAITTCNRWLLEKKFAGGEPREGDPDEGDERAVSSRRRVEREELRVVRLKRLAPADHITRPAADGAVFSSIARARKRE